MSRLNAAGLSLAQQLTLQGSMLNKSPQPAAVERADNSGHKRSRREELQACCNTINQMPVYHVSPAPLPAPATAQQLLHDGCTPAPAQATGPFAGQPLLLPDLAKIPESPQVQPHRAVPSAAVFGHQQVPVQGAAAPGSVGSLLGLQPLAVQVGATAGPLSGGVHVQQGPLAPLLQQLPAAVVAVELLCTGPEGAGSTSLASQHNGASTPGTMRCTADHPGVILPQPAQQQLAQQQRRPYSQQAGSVTDALQAAVSVPWKRHKAAAEQAARPRMQQHEQQVMPPVVVQQAPADKSVVAGALLTVDPALHPPSVAQATGWALLGNPAVSPPQVTQSPAAPGMPAAATVPAAPAAAAEPPLPPAVQPAEPDLAAAPAPSRFACKLTKSSAESVIGRGHSVAVTCLGNGVQLGWVEVSVQQLLGIGSNGAAYLASVQRLGGSSLDDKLQLGVELVLKVPTLLLQKAANQGGVDKAEGTWCEDTHNFMLEEFEVMQDTNACEQAVYAYGFGRLQHCSNPSIQLPALLLEHCNLGSWGDLLFPGGRRHRSLIKQDADTVHFIMRQLVEALMFIADINILHRDVKPDNLMFKGSSLGCCAVGAAAASAFGSREEAYPFVVKLGDFGCAGFRRGGFGGTNCVGTPAFLAPEMGSADATNHNLLADAFSAAMCCLVGRSGVEVPFLYLGKMFSDLSYAEACQLAETRLKELPSRWQGPQQK